jgi:hypothetical protein
MFQFGRKKVTLPLQLSNYAGKVGHSSILAQTNGSDLNDCVDVSQMSRMQVHRNANA